MIQDVIRTRVPGGMLDVLVRESRDFTDLAKGDYPPRALKGRYPFFPT